VDFAENAWCGRCRLTGSSAGAVPQALASAVSTSVPIAERLCGPMIRSRSQCPTCTRSSSSLGRSLIIVIGEPVGDHDPFSFRQIPRAAQLGLDDLHRRIVQALPSGTDIAPGPAQAIVLMRLIRIPTCIPCLCYDARDAAERMANASRRSLEAASRPGASGLNWPRETTASTTSRLRRQSEGSCDGVRRACGRRSDTACSGRRSS